MAFAEKRGSSWRVRFKLPDGTYSSASGFPTKQKALEYGQEQEVDVRRGDFYDRSQGEQTFGDWAEIALESMDLRPNSVTGYQKRLRCQINPRWGKCPLADITPSAVRKWEKELRKAISKNYADAVIGLFRIILDDAVNDRLIKTNPAQPQRRRRRGRFVRPVAVERLWATPAQVLQLAENMSVIWGRVGYAFILTKAYTGLRHGEMCGLQRSDCQLDAMPHAQRIQVNWQHSYVDKKPTLVEPKYDSRREMVVPPFLAGLLSEVLGLHDSDFVFPARNGGPLLTTDFSTYYWRPALLGSPARTGRHRRPELPAVTGLEAMRPHGLRHGHKVWLDEDGHSRVAVETRMGHLLPGVEGVYSHVSPVMEHRISEGLQARWERSVKGLPDAG
jgi:integrase